MSDAETKGANDEAETEGLAEAAEGDIANDAAPAEGGADGADDAEGLAEDDDGHGEGVDYVELVKIHNVRGADEAHLVRGILESFHIPCTTEDAAIDNFGGVLPSQLDGIDIFVPVGFTEKAKAVLCERNIACGVDPAKMEALLAEATLAAAQDDAKRAAIAARIGGEQRDFRLEALGRIGKRGADGVALIRALLKQGLRADETARVALDAAALANLGAFGKETALLVLDDLDHVKKDPDAAVRKRAATALGKLRGIGAGAALVELLGDVDAGVRDEALESLYAISGGETFDFDPELTPATQDAAIARWRAWAHENAAS